MNFGGGGGFLSDSMAFIVPGSRAWSLLLSLKAEAFLFLKAGRGLFCPWKQGVGFYCIFVEGLACHFQNAQKLQNRTSGSKVSLEAGRGLFFIRSGFFVPETRAWRLLLPLRAKHGLQSNAICQRNMLLIKFDF